MRLLRLEVDGFTAFREPTRIDFEPLSLFAICGPTGAGKSSLLDAITFALYGKVERVGRQVASLRSAGKAMLSVQLEFAAADQRYRVTRKLRAGGTQKALLERDTGTGFVDAGDGSDKVESVNTRIASALGIDYDAFVRTVVLPQGEFARFLNGDAKERRAILSDLLALGIYERMKIAANETAKRLSIEAGARADVIERTLSEATPATLAALDAELAPLGARIDDVLSARKLLDEHFERARALDARLDSLERAVAAIGEARRRLDDLDAEHARRLRERDEIEPRRAAIADAIQAADAEVRRHAQALDVEVREHGEDAALRAARDAALALRRIEADLATLDGRIEAGTARIAAGADALATQTAQLEEASTRIEHAQRELSLAEAALDAARRADHAGAACEGLAPGDPCPICAAALPDPLPPRPGSTLADATRRQAEARAGLDAALERHRELAADIEAGRERLSSARDLLAELTEDRRRLDDEAHGHRDALGAIGDHDAVGAIDDPLARLDELLARRDQMRSQRDEARERLDARRAEADAIAATVSAAEEALAGVAARRDAEQAALPRALEAHLGDTGLDPASEPERLDAALAELTEQTRRERAAILDDVAESLAGRLDDDDVPRFDSIDDAIERLDERRRSLEARAGELRARRRDIEARIEQRARLEAEVAELGATSDRLRVVGDHLASNRFVEFLQEDALRGLCAAGNEHLVRLSGDRYRLTYADGAFAVLDRWSADEQRSARTLSGGETFLASLSLALSLSDEVARLRIADAARLESLFLDEGFGTLDPGTLSDVEEALHRLSASGRQIGVITHIDALAERLPVRIQVEKHPAGSRIEIIT